MNEGSAKIALRMKHMASVFLFLALFNVSGCAPTTIDPPAMEWNLAPPPDASPADGGLPVPPGGKISSNKTMRSLGTGRLIGSKDSASFNTDLPSREDAVATSNDGAVMGEEETQDPKDAGSRLNVNFVNLPVQQAAKVMLTDILKRDYVIDPKVDGKISVHTTGPVTKKKALTLFRSALRSVGAELVEVGGVLRISPSDQSVAEGMDISTGAPSEDIVGSTMNVVQLRYVSASEIKRILEPMTPKGGLINADERRGVLTLAGSPTEIALMREMIRLFDIDTMRGMSFALVPVKTADAEAVAEDLRKMFNSEGDGPMNGMIRFVPNKRLKSILVISPQRAYLARAETLIQKFDARAAGTDKQLYTYMVQNRPAKELAAVLNTMFSSETAGGGAGNRQVSPKQGTSSGFSSPQGSGSTGGGSGGGGASGLSASGLGSSGLGASGSGTAGGAGGTAGGGLSAGGQSSSPIFANAMNRGADSASAATGGASAGVDSTPTGALGDDSRMRITADDANNAILVMAAPPDYKRLLRVMENLDAAPNQVMIEATIAEVTLNDQLQFGVRWWLNSGASTAAFTDALGSSVTNTADALVSSVFPGFSYALRLASAKVTVNALQQVTDVNILSSPSLMVMDNKTATLQVGDQVPITTQSAQSTIGAGSPIVNSVTYKDTGVILSITPRINESGRILLDIEQEVSNVVPTVTSSINSPSFQQRRVKTSVVVNDHESVTLGGLIQDRQNIGRSQTPVLGDIPFIGNAFKNKDDQTHKTELIIIITPKMVRNVAEARRVTDEYRQRLNFAYPRPRMTVRPLKESVKKTLE